MFSDCDRLLANSPNWEWFSLIYLPLNALIFLLYLPYKHDISGRFRFIGMLHLVNPKYKDTTIFQNVGNCQSSDHKILQSWNFQQHHCENLKPHMTFLVCEMLLQSMRPKWIYFVLWCCMKVMFNISFLH